MRRDPDTRLPRDGLPAAYKLQEPVFVTRPTMPALDDYTALLKRVWDKKWLTNKGDLHQEFERRVAAYLGVENISLFCSGTTALLVALRAAGVHGGKVVTTPFTFPATPHAISWLGAQPVFCDIDPNTFNLDAEHLSELIDSETRAILPVHVYGIPCDVEAILRVAAEHDVPVVFDAAHGFGVRHQGRALADFGDASMLSFHATKLFSTAEGGAVVTQTRSLKQQLDNLKNFGIADAENVVAAGINGKMNEFQAAYGLLQLDLIDEEIAARRKLATIYRRLLGSTPGIDGLEEVPATRSNHAYFPILVRAERYGMNRDHLHESLKALNIITRKYFCPLCSTYPHYRALPSAEPGQLPVAEAAAEQILCLPIYGTLAPEIAERICMAISELHRLA